MKVIIVQKQREDQKRTEKMLQSLQSSGKCGYDLIGTAANGRKGYEMIRDACPDLVIMETELPGMNGLSVLKKLRRDQRDINVIMIAEGEDFRQVKQAIDLGADSYLIKPVSAAQLRQSVLKSAERIRNRRAVWSVFSVENIFMGCMNGQVRADETFNELMLRRHGFTLEDAGAVFAVWLGSGYGEQKEAAKKLMEQAKNIEMGHASHVLEADAWNLLLVVLYRLTDAQAEYTYFQEEMVPKLCGNLTGEVVCIWAETQKMGTLREVMKRMYAIRDWNLLYDRGHLIRQEEAETAEILPLKYPVDIESQVKKAVLEKDGEGIKKSYYRLYDHLRREPHTPTDMKECLIRFNVSLLNAYKMQREIESEIEVQRCMQMISSAMSWREIREAMGRFLDLLNYSAFEDSADERLSPLVRKTLQLIRKYYDQGITLEEIAERLFVSEEYLSTQFKKETGTGFTETVRRYRINRIKELLVGTKLKINQIAELTGYADAKYMSKVFKEETGMLPTEFRQSAH